MAVHRHNQNIGRQLDDLIVRVGDTLLLEGTIEDIQRLAADMNLLDINRPRVMAFRRSKAPIALAAIALIVTLSGLEVAPILPLTVIAVAGILVTRCVDSDEAFSFVDGRLLAMIFAMLAVGEGLDNSGAVELLVGAVHRCAGVDHIAQRGVIEAVDGLVLDQHLQDRRYREQVADAVLHVDIILPNRDLLRVYVDLSHVSSAFVMTQTIRLAGKK